MKASDAKEWIDYLQSFKIEHLIIIVLVFVLGYWLIHPDKVLVWKGIIQSLFKFSTSAQKNSIMNNIDEMPPKCHDCPYWELAEKPYVCSECRKEYEDDKD